MNTRSSKLSLAAILDTSIGRLHVFATAIMTVHLQPPMEFAEYHCNESIVNRVEEISTEKLVVVKSKAIIHNTMRMRIEALDLEQSIAINMVK